MARKVMRNIKNQIKALVSFKGTTLNSLISELSEIDKRIELGVSRMYKSELYLSKEIDEVKAFAKKITTERYFEASKKLKKELRENFEF